MGDNVTVELDLVTTSDQPALLIDGPLFGWSGEAEAYPDRHFPELEVRIDGMVDHTGRSLRCIHAQTRHLFLDPAIWNRPVGR